MPTEIKTVAQQKAAIESQKKIEADAKYKVGDIVTTVDDVPCRIIGMNKNDGWAATGWHWRIVKVYMEKRTLVYEVVANKAPKMYWQALKQSQISKKV